MPPFVMDPMALMAVEDGVANLTSEMFISRDIKPRAILNLGPDKSRFSK